MITHIVDSGEDQRLPDHGNWIKMNNGLFVWVPAKSIINKFASLDPQTGTFEIHELTRQEDHLVVDIENNQVRWNETGECGAIVACSKQF